MAKKQDGGRGPSLNRRTFGATAAAAAVAGIAPFNIVRAQGAKLKVGVVLPMSGYLAKIGQANRDGYEIALPMLRQLSGDPNLELVYGDTESDVGKARSVAEKLISEGAHVLSGAFDSGQTSAIAQVAEQKGVPFVINIAASADITEQGYKYVFRNFPNGPKIVIDAFNLQKELFQVSGKQPKSMVVMHVNDTFGTGVAGGIKALLPRFKMPYEITEMIAYDPRARDLSVEVAKAKGTGAEAVWTVSRLNDAMLITREMIKQRWEPMGILSSGPGYYEDQYLKTLGKNADFAISFVPWYDPTKDMTKRLLAAFGSAHPNAAVDTNHVYSFEAALIIADAYRRAKSTQGAALAEALRATDIKDNVSIGPGIKFNAKGHNEWLGDAGIQNLGGLPRVVLPVVSADAKLVFPMPGWRDRA